jgi:hypothetical protein
LTSVRSDPGEIDLKQIGDRLDVAAEAVGAHYREVWRQIALIFRSTHWR